MINLLYLCDKKHWQQKMSRGRFHCVNYLAEHKDLCVTIDGPGAPQFVDARTSQAASGADVVMWYKPLEIKGYDEVTVPKIISYNETYDTAWTTEEIDKSKSDMIIFRHLNDMPWYQTNYGGSKFMVNIPHSADKRIYKDYGLPKTVDLLMIGAVQDHYPLRQRMLGIFKKMPDRFVCRQFAHPGYDLQDAHTDRYAVTYAKAINAAKVCVTCSGRPRSRYAKYSEVPMAASALAADLPNEQHEDISQFLIEINRDMSDDEIINKLTYYLDNDDERQKLVDAGVEYARDYTMGQYANRFVNALKEFLSGTTTSGIA